MGMKEGKNCPNRFMPGHIEQWLWHPNRIRNSVLTKWLFPAMEATAFSLPPLGHDQEGWPKDQSNSIQKVHHTCLVRNTCRLWFFSGFPCFPFLFIFINECDYWISTILLILPWPLGRREQNQAEFLLWMSFLESK